MKNYNCMTCQEPMKISIFFHTYIRQHGPQVQKCFTCGALHDIDEKNNVRLKVMGTPMARLSMEFPYPEHKPYRVGPYRVRYSNGTWSKVLVTYDGDVWRNGPVLFHAGSIVAWQGLAGDMEHTKRMPYDMVPPMPYMGDSDE
jgi:DNA-directed RNA polymerase subunit RPC12/RpoP